MDLPQEAAPEPSDAQSDDSTISYQEVDKPNRGMSEALRFVRSVRLAFGDDSKEYVEFLYLMNEFKNKRTNIQAFQLRVRDLFKEHPELVAGFNTFLPAGYEIPVQDQNDEIVFVNKVKAAYGHDGRRYKCFLDLMNRMRKDKNVLEAYKEACILFHDRRDLIVEFITFLPFSSNSMTTEAENERKLNLQYSKWRKGEDLLFAMAFFLVLLLVLGLCHGY
ncbi:hypothetical protein RHSIM_Rhsim08G0164700 [Rhododendron simsii]|uniref:Uncharacterized protein n=1 Tax=Rhododendron simsii TaxID=118357 RepID=A0A834GK58_RHOSS|nr:hypothetical protein RHSIM_Rhsim08G0164700 [Rhododendron simsii]